MMHGSPAGDLGQMRNWELITFNYDLIKVGEKGTAVIKLGVDNGDHDNRSS